MRLIFSSMTELIIWGVVNITMRKSRAMEPTGTKAVEGRSGGPRGLAVVRMHGKIGQAQGEYRHQHQAQLEDPGADQVKELRAGHGLDLKRGHVRSRPFPRALERCHSAKPA